MKIAFVPFENIDKNKWNGTIHYATNSNVYGYYWYLKSVIREWDALVEGDYQSVMPLPRYQWSDFERKLLPALGPYTVNAITESRASHFYNQWKAYAGQYSYHFNTHFTTPLYKSAGNVVIKNHLDVISLQDPYSVIEKNYSNALQENIQSKSDAGYILEGHDKPEQILANEKIPDIQKNTYYRVFYNAIQRGTGWHLKVTHKVSGQTASCFFISDQGNIYNIYRNKTNHAICECILLDTLINNHAGKPGILYLHPDQNHLIKEFNSTTLELLSSPAKEMSVLNKFKSLFFGR